MSILLKLIPGSLPENYTPESWQDHYNRIFELGRAYWPDGFTIVNYGSTTPTGANTAYPWVRTVAPGKMDRIYNYYNGLWISPHPLPAKGDLGDYFTALWTGSTANLDLYEGGTAGTPTEYTGPFWEVNTDFQAKFPIGVGTLPSTTVLAVGDTGGEETHLLTEAELPTLTLEQGPIVRLGPTGLNLGGGSTHTQTAAPYTIGSDDPHNNMPPYKAVYFIRRTIRKYYTA